MSDKLIFKVFILKIYFSLLDLDMKWIGTIRTIYKDGHIRIIPTKFSQNLASCLGGYKEMPFEAIVEDRPLTRHDGLLISNNHNSSP